MSRSNEWILVGKATVWLHFDGHVVDCKGHTQFREKILKENLKKKIWPIYKFRNYYSEAKQIF